MLTQFGKEIRKLRIDHQPPLKLKDLADAIDVSSAYLSAVETGNKTPSPSLVDKIADKLKVDQVRRKELHSLARESQKVVQLDLSESTNQAKELAVAFARRFTSLNEGDMERLMQIIERDQNAPLKRVK